MDFASSTRAAENKIGGKGLLRSHPWCPNDLASLWDGSEKNRIETRILYEINFTLFSNCRPLAFFRNIPDS